MTEIPEYDGGMRGKILLLVVVMIVIAGGAYAWLVRFNESIHPEPVEPIKAEYLYIVEGFHKYDDTTGDVQDLDTKPEPPLIVTFQGMMMDGGSVEIDFMDRNEREYRIFYDRSDWNISAESGSVEGHFTIQKGATQFYVTGFDHKNRTLILDRDSEAEDYFLEFLRSYADGGELTELISISDEDKKDAVWLKEDGEVVEPNDYFDLILELFAKERLRDNPRNLDLRVP